MYNICGSKVASVGFFLCSCNGNLTCILRRPTAILWSFVKVTEKINSNMKVEYKILLYRLFVGYCFCASHYTRFGRFFNCFFVLSARQALYTQFGQSFYSLCTLKPLRVVKHITYHNKVALFSLCVHTYPAQN